MTNESTGRGLLARRNVNEGDELLTIPMNMCLTIGSARKAFGSKVIQEGMNEYLAIALQLIREKYALGPKSYFKDYVGVLPEVHEVNPTFTWSDEDLEFLEGSPIIAATRSMQFKLRREYDALLGGEDGLIARYPKKFPAEYYTIENWVWAFTMLFSRAIRLRNLVEGEALAMVPYADLINHSAFSGAYVDARQSGSWLFKDGDEEIILYAERSYRKMEQVRTQIREVANFAQTLTAILASSLFIPSSLVRFTFPTDQNPTQTSSSYTVLPLSVTPLIQWM